MTREKRKREKFLKPNNLYCLKSGNWSTKEPSKASRLLMIFGFLIRLPDYTGI